MRHEFDVSVRVGKAGAIVSDDATPVLHDLQRPEDDGSVEFYGGRYFLCGSVTGTAAERIVLCWELCRSMTNEDLREAIRLRLDSARLGEFLREDENVQAPT